MESGDTSDTNKTQQPAPSLREEMSKLIESMDPQGLLNIGDQEDNRHSNSGVDPSKEGDAHRDEHEISLTDNGSDRGSAAGSGSEHDGSERAGSAKKGYRMEVGSPNFRIVDILPPATLQAIVPLQPPVHAAAGQVPVPLQGTGTKDANTVRESTSSTGPHNFVVPTSTADKNPNQTIRGKNIFVEPPKSKGSALNPENVSSQTSQNMTDTETASNIRKVPSGVKPPNPKNSLPPKKTAPVEPDAVPSKTYEAILANKKKQEKAGTIGGIASGQGPTEVGSFFNKGDNRVLRSVYREDVSKLSISSLSFNPVSWKCASCPNNHSILEGKGGRCVIILADQNFPAVLPSAENRCMAIVRLEHGSLDELIDLFLKISRPVTIPEGTIILFGSLSSLARIGTQSYASACINGKRRITGAIKNSVAVPFVPPPLGGCNDPELIRNLVDVCVWLGSISGFPLSGTCKVLVDLIMDEVDGGEGEVKHLDRPVFLPTNLDSYDGEHVTSPGRPGIPAFVPSWSQTDEKRFLDGLLTDLNDSLLAGLDPNPNLSRSKTKPSMYPAVRSGSVERIVFIGGSNAKNLSQAASMLGIDAHMIASGGWKLTRENVDKLLPDLHELLSSLPPATPIVLFCLDNSSFLAATEEGGMVPISKCVPGDKGYHVNGALVVAPERALQLSLDQLKRIVEEFPDYDFFIISPVTRYVANPCCTNTSHVTNFGDPDFLSSIISDLTKLKFQLRKKLQPAVILDGIELACGAGCGREKVEQTLRAGWALDPVHPTSHVYAKMALNLIEKVAAPASKPDSRKRKRSDESGSGTGSHGGAPAPLPRSNRQSDFQRDLSRDRSSGAGYNPHQSGSGYGSGYGDYRQSHSSRGNFNPSRGRAGSVSSRGTSGAGSNRFEADRGRGYQGSRGGFEGGYGGRGLPRGRPWPRW
jgi:hypothetical protein